MIYYTLSIRNLKQDCSYQGEALNVPTADKGLWSSNIITKLSSIFFKSSPHTPYKVQKDRFRYL